MQWSERKGREQKDWEALEHRAARKKWQADLEKLRVDRKQGLVPTGNLFWNRNAAEQSAVVDLLPTCDNQPFDRRIVTDTRLGTCRTWQYRLHWWHRAQHVSIQAGLLLCCVHFYLILNKNAHQALPTHARCTTVLQLGDKRLLGLVLRLHSTSNLQHSCSENK